MEKNRFQNYVAEFEKNTTCQEFLEDQLQNLDKIKNSDSFSKDFKIYQALSNKKRFQIYQLLKIKPMCTCALAKIFQVADGTITHHLKQLEAADLIIGKKEGYFTRYYSKSLLENLIQDMS